jgi:hypothetical protein
VYPDESVQAVVSSAKAVAAINNRNFFIRFIF